MKTNKVEEKFGLQNWTFGLFLFAKLHLKVFWSFGRNFEIFFQQQIYVRTVFGEKKRFPATGLMPKRTEKLPLCTMFRTSRPALGNVWILNIVTWQNFKNVLDSDFVIFIIIISPLCILTKKIRLYEFRPKLVGISQWSFSTWAVVKDSVIN